MTDLNQMLGEVMNSPMFWGVAVIAVVVILGWRYGLFKKVLGGKPEFKGEPLKETLLKDLEPRLKYHGKKVKGILTQDYTIFGKVKSFCKGKFEYWRRTLINLEEVEEEKWTPINRNPDNPGKGKDDKKDKNDKNDKKEEKKSKEKVDDEKPIFEDYEKKEVTVIYFLVGGNAWLAWIPYIGKGFEPRYYVINEEYIKHDPKSQIFSVDTNVHLYPYADIWISDVKTQEYLTELSARRTQEFEDETNVNTLKRWTYQGSQQAGKVVIMEKETDLERQKWEGTETIHE